MKKNKNNILLLVFSTGLILSSVASASFLIRNSIENIYKDKNNIGTEPKAYIVGRPEKYTTIERALDAADINDIVMVIPPSDKNYNDVSNPNNPDKIVYELGSCTIKKGVTLFIPTDYQQAQSIVDNVTLNEAISNMQNSKRDQGNSGYNLLAEDNPDRFLRVTVKVKKDATIKNQGTIVIGGFLSGGTSNAGIIGQTSHSYSRIVLEDNSSILQDTSAASLYCFGYIEESSKNNGSKVNLSNGKLYVPLIIRDFRGFTYSYSMTGGAIDKEHCSPFNEFEFRNITSNLNINYNGNVVGVVNCYIYYENSAGLVKSTAYHSLNVVGNMNGAFIQFKNEFFSTLNFKFDKEREIFSINLYGENKINPISLHLEATGTFNETGETMTQSVDLETKNTYFPISYKYQININRGSGAEKGSLDLTSQKIKLLPGSSVSIGSYMEITGDELVAYTAFFDGSNGAAQGVSRNPGRTTYPVKKGAQCVIDATSSLSFNKIAGTFYSNNSNNIKFSNSDTIASKEPRNTKDNSGFIPIPPWIVGDFLILNEKLNVVPTSYLNLKKIFVGTNSFSSTEEFKPKIEIIIDEKDTFNVDTYQTTIFLNEINTYKIKLLNNVYSVFTNTGHYSLENEVDYTENNSVFIMNSNREISSDVNGIDEFKVQKITITGPSNQLDVGSVMQLNGSIVDINKTYDKNYLWSSSNNQIATVSQNGLVKGISEGEVKITLSCGNVTQEYSIMVEQPSTSIISVESIEIVNKEGLKQKEKFKDGDYNFEVKVSPNDTDILDIKWSIAQNNVAKYALINANGETVNSLSGTKTVTLRLNVGARGSESGLGSDDPVTINCEVTDKTGKTVTNTFSLMASGSKICFAKGTLIETKRGAIKVENLNSDDVLLTFNHFTGKLEYKPIALLIRHNKNLAYDIKLSFDNGLIFLAKNAHSLFDTTINKYIDITNNNAKKFIGHDFIYLDKNKQLNKTKLINAEISVISEESYSLISYENYNCFANTLLNVTPDVILNANAFGFIDLKYNMIFVNDLINKIGLTSVEDFIKRYPFGKSEACYHCFNLKFAKIFQKLGVYDNTSIDEFVIIFNYLIEAKEAIIHI